jgi:hypothetical protein
VSINSTSTQVMPAFLAPRTACSVIKTAAIFATTLSS